MAENLTPDFSIKHGSEAVMRGENTPAHTPGTVYVAKEELEVGENQSAPSGKIYVDLPDGSRLEVNKHLKEQVSIHEDFISVLNDAVTALENGSTEKHVELTQAEYNALPVKDSETIYFIKDATAQIQAKDVVYGSGTVAGQLDKINSGYVSTLFTNKTVSSGTATSVGSIALTPGLWYIIVTCSWSYGSVGYRIVSLADDATTLLPSRIDGDTRSASGMNQVANQGVYGSFSRLINITSNTTKYINVFQTNGTNLTAYGAVQAIKLK